MASIKPRKNKDGLIISYDQLWHGAGLPCGESESEKGGANKWQALNPGKTRTD